MGRNAEAADGDSSHSRRRLPKATVKSQHACLQQLMTPPEGACTEAAWGQKGQNTGIWWRSVSHGRPDALPHAETRVHLHVARNSSLLQNMAAERGAKSNMADISTHWLKS